MRARLASLLDAVLRRRRFEDGMALEIEQHVEAHAADLVRRGVSAADARRQARAAFGSVAATEDRCRDARGLRLPDEMAQDIRVGWRHSRRAPLTSTVALATIAVATGLSTLVAALLYSVLLRPLPFADPDRLVALQPAAGQFEALDLRAFREQQTSFVQVHGYYQRSVTLTGAGPVPESLPAAFVTAGLFDMLGTRPLAGRTFRTGEDFTAQVAVALISERLWRDTFGADPAMLTRTLTLDGRDVRVVGVLPDGVHFPMDEDVWLPMDFPWPTAADPGSGRAFQVAGRLRPSVPRETAEAEARQLFARLWGERESAATGQAAPRVVPLATQSLQAGLPWLLAMAALAAAGVLLVACANIATLTLARSTGRRIEVAVRLALGAGRARVIRQFAVEALVLTVPGVLIGVWLAAAGLRLFARFESSLGLPAWAEVRLDPPVITLAAALTTAVAVTANLLPALHATQRASQGALVLPTRGARQRGRAMSWLVGAQVAGACALLVAAGLLARSGLNVAQTDLGFDPSRVLAGQMTLPAAAYPDPSGAMLRVLDQVSAAPLVESASLVRLAPGTGPAFAWSFAVEGEAYGPERPLPAANGLPVAHDYFATMGIALVDGRDFAAAESRFGAEPVLIANETLARRYLGDRPLATRIRIGTADEGPWLPVVGVVADTYVGSRNGGIGLSDAPVPQLYLSWGAAPYSAGTLVVRTAADTPATALPAVRDALAAAAPAVPWQGAGPLAAMIDESTWAIRLFGWAFGTFGGVTLLMSAMGLFGVLAFAVRARTHEIGVRMALGAGSRAVLRLVGDTVAAPVGAGLLVGLAASVPLARALGLLLFGVRATDVVVYALVALTLGASVLTAACGPALRATRVNPVIALRID